MDFIKIGRRTLSNEKTRHMSLSNLLRPSYIKVFRSYFNLLFFILLSFIFVVCVCVCVRALPSMTTVGYWILYTKYVHGQIYINVSSVCRPNGRHYEYCESVRKKFHSRYHYVGSSIPLCTCN